MRWSFAQKARACTDTTLRLCQPPRDATCEPENRRKGPRRAESRQDNTSLPFPLPLAVPMLKDARASSSRAWTLFYNNAALGGRRHKRILDRSVDDRAKGRVSPIAMCMYVGAKQPCIHFQVLPVVVEETVGTSWIGNEGSKGRVSHTGKRVSLVKAHVSVVVVFAIYALA